MVLIRRHRLLMFLCGCLVMLGSYTTVLQSVENLSYDLFVRLLPQKPDTPKVAVVAIDNKAIANHGPWPWPRDRLAKTIRQLEKLGAASIGLLVPMDQPQSLSLPENYQQVLKGSSKKVKDKLLKILDQLDPDAVLTNALVNSDKVVLAVPYWNQQAGLIEPVSNDLSMILQGVEVNTANDTMSRFQEFAYAPPNNEIHLGRGPVPSFGLSAKAVGLARLGRINETVLSETLAVFWQNKYVPSFALQVVAQTFGVSLDNIKVMPNHGVHLGSANYPTDSGLRYFTKPILDKEGEPSHIPQYSIADLLDNKLKKSQIQNKAILVGFTADGLAHTFSGPGGMQVTPVAWSAHTVDALLSGASIHTPPWALGMQRAFILIFMLYLIFMPVKLRGRLGQVVTLLLAVVLVNTSLLLLLVQSTWIPLTLPAIFVLLGHILLTSYHHVADALRAQRNQASEAYHELANNLHNQGKLDQAFKALKKCTPDRGLLEPLYNLGLDFERRRQFSRALSVYDHMIRIDPKYKDIGERRERHQTTTLPGAGSLKVPASNGNLGATLVVDDSMVERPVLGRYKIQSELGRGAMGMVYLGVDPKIGRTVAIKTVSLADEFNADQMEDIRSRFFAEAESAGRLNHPNIVTIYDAGEEHDLAYIAMDYIEGDSLDKHNNVETLLAVEKVFRIGVQVAEALDYAHKKKVVHRDVKPSNIIYNNNSGTVKITDFGIACMTDNSKTRTGTILGSPSYMSPEQLEAKKIDGRSDIFSLGVTLYELFTGSLPFQADNMAALAYQIANEKSKGIRKVRSELPVCLTRVINKALEKNPSNRYDTGRAFADALRRCGKID